MARRFYTLGPGAAKVTSAPEQAARMVAEGLPAVLVGPDAERLGTALAAAPDRQSGQRLLAVMVGDPTDAAVAAAASEMAAELWPWVAKALASTPEVSESGRPAGPEGVNEEDSAQA